MVRNNRILKSGGYIIMVTVIWYLYQSGHILHTVMTKGQVLHVLRTYGMVDDVT